MQDAEFDDSGVVLAGTALQDLFDGFHAAGYRVIGPRVRDAAIVYDELSSAAELPQGYVDEQQPGSYRLRKTDSGRYFDFVVGPQSWKRFLYPPRRKLWEANRVDGDWQPEEAEDTYAPAAFLGVRACEIEGIRVLDRVLRSGSFDDPVYSSRRSESLIVALDCARPASTCFCTSMGGGPSPKTGFDLTLSELGAEESHHFLIRAGSARGAELLSSLSLDAATDSDLREAAEQVSRSVDSMRPLPQMMEAREILEDAWTSPRWEAVADRCLSCANCTMACPTCFCVDVEDVTDLTGDHAERWQQWDSCFTMSHSYLHGGSVRKTTASRYRQWLTHKLSTWHDQFDTSGCVGCGRCITWCPVGIDIRDEVAAIKAETSPDGKR